MRINLHKYYTIIAEISVPLHSAVITLCVFNNSLYIDIEKKLGIPASSAVYIWQQVVKKAGNTDIHNLLQYIDSKLQNGRPQTIEKDSEESLYIRSLLLSYLYNTFQQVIEKENLLYIQSVIERVAKNHSSIEIPQPIVRKNICLKLYLDNILPGVWLKFCKWALSELKAGSIFIFSDESYINFGGNLYKKRRITVQ